MSRSIRFIPEQGALVEITCRTIQSRFLLRPDPALDEIVLGVLGRAQRLHPVEIVACFVASNHYHLLAWVPDVERMADFMEFFQSNVAKKVIKLRKWRDKVWSRRYEAIVISDEPAAQVDRLRYVLSNGVKEGLVGRVEDWPGINLVRNVLSGQPVRGTWFDRTEEHKAKLRREDFGPRQYATEETVELSPLPCFRHLSPEVYRELVAGLVQEIDAEAAAERRRTGRQPLGAAAILRQHPHTWPNRTKKSPAPRFHAATKAAREALRAAYGLFLVAFREAAERLKAGDRSARFPSGCFPPGLPFVRA